MSTITCPKCKGFRKIPGLGMIDRDCPKCHASGRVEATAVVEPVKSVSDTPTQLQTDLRDISDAYATLQVENEELKAEIKQLKAKKKKAK